MSFSTAAKLVKSVGALKKLVQRKSLRGRDGGDGSDGGNNFRERQGASFKHKTRGSRGMGRVAELLRGGGHSDTSPTGGSRRSAHLHMRSHGHGHRKRGSQEVVHQRGSSSVSQEDVVLEETEQQGDVGSTQGEGAAATSSAEEEGSQDIQIRVP